MNIILYYLLRRFFVKLRFERGFIILEKGILLRRRAVLPLGAVTRAEIRRTPLLRLIRGKKVTVETLSGKISFYLKKNESLPFIPVSPGHTLRPGRASVFFGAFVDTRALSGVVLFSATIYRLGKILGGSYADRIIAAITDTADELAGTLEKLHIAVPRAAAAAAVFVLTAWGFLFLKKLIGMADFRVCSRGGYLTVKRGLITLYEQVIVLNNLDAVISCGTVTTAAAGKAPLYARGTLIFPPVDRETSRRIIGTLCGLSAPSAAEVKPPLKALFGHCAVPLGWLGGLSAALILTHIAEYYELIPAAALLKTLLWCGIAASLWSTVACGVYWRLSGISRGGSLKISARKGTRLYTGYIPERFVTFRTVSQNPFQRRSGLCDYYVALYGKRRFRLRGVYRSEIPR